MKKATLFIFFSTTWFSVWAQQVLASRPALAHHTVQPHTMTDELRAARTLGLRIHGYHFAMDYLDEIFRHRNNGMPGWNNRLDRLRTALDHYGDPLEYRQAAAERAIRALMVHFDAAQAQRLLRHLPVDWAGVHRYLLGGEDLVLADRP